MPEVILTQDELVALCAEWQKVLRLQDWTIGIALCRERNLKVGGQGENEYQIASKEALIRILDPVDYSENNIFPQDMERTLVHELLHLHFAPFTAKDGTSEDTAQEQAIHAISSALVGLKRKNALEGGFHE